MFVQCNPLADVPAHAAKAATQETPEETWQRVLCVSSGSVNAEAEGPRKGPVLTGSVAVCLWEGAGQQPRAWSEGQEGQTAVLWHRAVASAVGARVKEHSGELVRLDISHVWSG